ncbi:putative ferric-chelate reductase 1 isoform X2 [Eleginops maclovinus]|uniref:putative ferric-chelate reductase 1 isoform X2 n=1 Tax=Eleginops maclovinus TaxID=56733 RepID=UPI00308078AE
MTGCQPLSSLPLLTVQTAPAMWRSYFLLAALLWRADPVSGFSNGKVSVACGDMVPQHEHDPSPAPPPFSITVDTSSFSPGDNITVTLQVASSTPTYFMGFLIEAREAGKLNSQAVGSFVLTDPQESQLLQCGHTQGSGVSHRRGKRKTHIQAVWEPPNNPPQRVQFLVTVVHEFEVYWVRIKGPVVSLKGSTAAPSTPVPAPTTSSTPLSEPFSSAGCGRSKSCLRDPVGCHPESDPACFFLSFVTDQPGSSVMFELSGPAEGYLAFALSLDKWMGNDEVYMCVNDGGSVTISASYVSGRTHPELEMQNLWGRAWRFADGSIQCRFQRKTFLPHAEGRFNLNQSYFLFLANGRSHQGLIHRHDRQPLISTNQKEITGHPEDLCGSRSPLLIKFHGVLMLTVWMWMVSTAIFIARHYKNTWPETTVLGQKLWFQLHRTMMVLAVLLTGVAFTLPFIYRRGWSKRAGSHPYIGCTVMALSVIQLIMAALRPAPDSPRRIIFNWMHFVTGTGGQILAVACVFLGVAQQALLLPGPYSPAMLTAWLLWIVLAHLLLQIHSCRLRRGGSSDSEDKENIRFAQSGRQQPEEKSQVKKMVFVVFLMGNTAFLAAFLKAIASV